MPKFFREPLLQFFLLAVLIFGVERWVFENTYDPRRIVVDDGRYAELLAVFKDGKGRIPTEAEIGDLMLKWSQNEVLYREARLLGLDNGDEMIRQRLILKMRDILFNNIVIEVPPDAELIEWFEQNRTAYDRPDLYDFEQFLVRDAADAAGVSQLARTLGTQAVPQAYEPVSRRYSRRPAGNLSAVFGDDGGRRLLDAEDNAWVAVQSAKGWHLSRITARYPGDPAEFEKIRQQVVTDWIDFAKQRELAQALASVVDQYDIRIELTREGVEESLGAGDIGDSGEISVSSAAAR